MAPTDSFHTVLELCLPHVQSMRMLVFIAATNHRSSVICASHAHHQLQHLLVPVLEQAARWSGSPLQKQHIGSIRWLCRVAGREAFAAATAAVIEVPEVPVAVAKLLCHAGVRITYEQLVVAARNRTTGVEVWVQPDRTDLPAVVVKALYEGNTRVGSQL